MRPPGPTPESPAAAQQLEQLGADQLAAPALQRAHVGLLEPAAGGDDDRREVGARGDQLVGQAGLLRTAADERLGERDHRAVLRLGGEALHLLQPDRLGREPALDGRQDGVAAAAHDVGVDAADLPQLATARGRALGHLDERRVAHDGADRAVLGLGGALAPGPQLAGHGALARAQPGRARQPPPHLLGVALVGRLLDRPALLARPLESARGLEPAAQLVRQVEQVLDVALGVAQLLLGQRPGVPAREARRLGEPDPQHVVQKPAVAGLGGEAGEPGGDLRVEHARELGAPLAAQDRHVLAAGVDHDLHLGVGEHGGERLVVEARPAGPAPTPGRRPPPG